MGRLADVKEKRCRLRATQYKRPAHRMSSSHNNTVVDFTTLSCQFPHSSRRTKAKSGRFQKWWALDFVAFSYVCVWNMLPISLQPDFKRVLAILALAGPSTGNISTTIKEVGRHMDNNELWVVSRRGFLYMFLLREISRGSTLRMPCKCY